MFANYQILNFTKRIGEGTLKEEIVIFYLQQIFVSKAELLTWVGTESKCIPKLASGFFLKWKLANLILYKIDY